ncbi:MAG: TonB-dependent receptor plug domain-containing protein [Rikenellaceae bacterium]|jgi:iron complex outermembrane receptor protein|nr:TonB-dependent receptor plug domain-containing protein [Rikenellaceae bacterium]
MNKNHNEEPLWCFHRWSRKPWAAFAGMCRFKYGRLSVAMAIILLATPFAGAQTVGTDSLSQFRTLHLDTVQVTALGNVAVQRTGGSQTALLIEHRGVAPLQTTESVLRLTPSLDVRERGGKATQADISIRGGSFDETMVMLNGINFSDARTGHQSHSLPVDIDILSGIAVTDAVSPIGALAGAVDFRTAPLYPNYLRAHLSGGAWGYGYGNLSGAWTGRGLSVLGAASVRHSDGYRYNTDFTNLNAYTRVQYTSPRAGGFDVQAGFQRRAWGSNGFYSLVYPDQFEQTATGLASLRWQKSWHRWAAGASASWRKNLDRYEMQRGDPSTIPFNYHNTSNFGTEAWASRNWLLGRTTLRAEAMWNSILSTVLGEPIEAPTHKIVGTDGFYTHSKTRHTASVRLSHAKRWRSWTLEGEGGVATNPYGTTATWMGGVEWRPREELTLSAVANNSLRLPTFTELYYSVPKYHPDPNLAVEKAVTVQLGADWSVTRSLAVSGTLYYRRTRNVIDWEQHEGGDWFSTQLNRLGTFGGELSLGYSSPTGWLRLATLGYGYIRTDKNVATDYISKYALDYLRHKASAVVGVVFLRHFTATVTGSFYDRVGGYIAENGSYESFKPYFLLDGRVSWERSWAQLYVDVTNITSTRYFDFGGLPMPGAWLSAGVVITLK